MTSYRYGLNPALTRGLLLALFIAIGSPFPAFAALGGSSESVQADGARLKASIRITDGGGYTVHEMTTPTSTVVREYVAPGGRVFGVAWRGPFIPQLQQLLGVYFQKYVPAAKAERERHVGRVPLNIQQRGLVVQTGGHMRAFFGRAYDPELLPEGVSPDDVR